jgi:hypothetical protein
VDRLHLRAVVLLLSALGCVNLTPPAELRARRDAQVDMAPAPDARPNDANVGAPDVEPDADQDVSSDIDPNDGGGEVAGEDASDPEGELGNGRPCTSASGCQSGFCVDGVCCANACTTGCHSCAVKGREGTCAPVAAGEDPRNECPEESAASCQRDGTCNGAGACRLHVSGTTCAPAGCSDAIERAASTCNGTGTCKPGATHSCSPGVCQGNSCGTACVSDGECLTGFFCESSVCRPKRGNGLACTTAAQCMSGVCADGVCCATACTAGCVACNLAGTVGVCTPVPAGVDPGNDCVSELQTTCGRTGACDGKGGCQLYGAGSICSAASCAGATETLAGTCDGAGACLPGAARDCGAFVCSGAACATSCTTAAQCRAGYACVGNTCVSSSPPDAGSPDAPPANQLLLDNFSDSNQSRNTFGGAVSWINQTVSTVNGELKMVWKGSGDYQDFIEVFRSDWCDFNLTAYNKVRFRMRASAPNRKVEVLFAIGNGRCDAGGSKLISTITPTTTMTTYEVDIRAVARDKIISFEFVPLTLDSTAYFVDDIVFVP